MTATAFALDPTLDIFDLLDTVDTVGSIEEIESRPQLRLIQGERYDQVLPTTERAALAASVEVYRRRRFLALVAVTVLVLGIAWAAGISVVSFSGQTAGAVVDTAPAVHVVLPGDSYAAIAADLGVANPVAAAEQMRVANGGSELIVGQRLVVDLATFTAAG